MSEVASAYVSLIPSFRGGAAGISKALGDSPSSAGKEQGGKFSSSFGFAMGAIKKTALGVGLTAGGILGTSLTKGFKRLSAIENAKAKLAGLGHTAGTVQVIMDNAMAAVKGTAFGMDEAASTAAGAVAAGVKPGKELQRILSLTGDAATIAGTSMGEMGAIFNKVASSNKIQGDVIAQLNDAGIPIIQLLGKTLGKTSSEVTALASKGKIDFPMFAKAMEQGLGGAALKSGNTTSGALKNMNAALGRFGATLLSGVFPVTKRVFGGMTTLLDKANVSMKPLAEKVGPNIAKGMAIANSAIGQVFKGFSNTKSVDGSSSALARFGVAVRGAFNGVQKMIAVLVPIVAAFIKSLSDKWAEIGPKVTAAFTQIGQIIVGVLDYIGLVIRTDLAIIQFIWANWGATITRYVSTSLSNVLTIVNGVLTVIRGIILTVTSLIKGDWSGVWNGIKLIFSGVWTVIKGIVAQALNFLRFALSAAWIAIKLGVSAAWGGIKSLISSAWSGIIGLVSSGVSGIVSTVTALPGKIVSLGGQMLDAGKSLIGKLWEGITGSVTSAASKVADALKSALNSVLGLPWELPAFDTHIPGVGKIGGYTLLDRFARGGIPATDGPSWVGENGPELFVPNVRGRVLSVAQSKAALSGGGSDGTGMPSTLVVVDADGALIGRMRVEAHKTVGSVANELRLR